MNAMTKKLLRRCAKAGITKVSISRKHRSVPASMSWPFCHEGCVFTYEPKASKKKREVEDDDPWPPIWKIVEDLGIYRGSGNEDEAAIKAGFLDDGVFHLKDGQWKEVG